MKISLQKYRRLGPVSYSRWVLQANGLGEYVSHTEDAIDYTSNHTINAFVANLLDNIGEAPVEEEINPLVQEDTPTPFTIDKVQYDSLTVVELRELCKKQGLPVYGTKAEIVLRLNQNDEGVTDGPTEEVAPEETPDAPTEEVAVTNGSATDDKTTSNDEQEPIIE